MNNSELKNMASSTLREAKDSSEKIVDEASPRVRETIDQVSEVASDLYGKASDWLSEGDRRNYGFIALAASAGIVGFFLGRRLGSRQV